MIYTHYPSIVDTEDCSTATTAETIESVLGRYVWYIIAAVLFYRSYKCAEYIL